ncbi:MAG: hypothetical protein PUP92_34365 [Rhizonema sp. PD38]|nr:hypothetical protein [Rhizonema sp. PD38]
MIIIVYGDFPIFYFRAIALLDVRSKNRDTCFLLSSAFVEPVPTRSPVT